jgi:hypothetical protein
MTSPTLYLPFAVDDVTLVTVGAIAPVGIADDESADADDVPAELVAVLLNL